MNENEIREKIIQLNVKSNNKYNNGGIGDAALFFDVFKNEIKYVPQKDQWYAYNGKQWTADTFDPVEERIKNLGIELLKYSFALNDRELQRHFEFWLNPSKRSSVLKDAETIAPFDFKRFDANPNLLNCKNGTLDLVNIELLDYNPNDLITKMANVEYQADVFHSRFLNFIDEITENDDELKLFLQKALGYGLTGLTELECMFILYGSSTRNGKTTLMNSVANMLGDYAGTVNPATISTKKYVNSSGPTEDILRLNKLRLANIAEPSKDMVFGAEIIKSITGNENMLARGLHEKHSIEFKPEFKMYINTNHLPNINDTTLFESNRIYIIPFNRHFEPEEQDMTLKAKFQSEEAKSSILNWMLAGLIHLQTNGLEPPQSVLNAIENYRIDSDVIGQFINENMEFHSVFEEKTTNIYCAYQNWCQSTNNVIENQKTFKVLLEKYGTITKKRPLGGGNATNMFSGGRLISNNNQAA